VKTFLFGLAIVALAAARSTAAPDAVPHLRRVAIVVGANEPPPGHQALRFAHEDAKRISDVLRRVGDFADVKLLLDPHPRELLAALQDIAAPGGGLVLFYYSGHSDGRSIFPHGETLAIAEIRDRLAQMNAQIRVGILDTCRGGEWTQTKGFTVGPPLDPIDLLNVATEGTALIASSAGLENAHEAEAVKGSFFTHHFAAGLLGAADTSRDGDVTLQEAFDYAKERTVRDTALLAPTPQHPSFDINLRGRQDIVLASTQRSASALEIAAPRQLLQVIHLDSGLVIAEAPPSASPLRLAVAPGQYLVRRGEAGRVWAKQVAVRPGETIKVTEADLQLSGSPRIAVKGVVPIDRASSSPKRWWILQIAAGVSTGPTRIWGTTPVARAGGDTMQTGETLERSAELTGGLTYGITDRLTWAVPVPAFAYRFGQAGALELVPRAGLTGLGYSSIEGLIGTVDVGAAVRAWASPTVSFIAAGAADWDFNTGGLVSREMLTTSGNLGVAWEPSSIVALHLGVGLAVPHRTADPPPELMAPPLTSTVSIGSIQTLGYRALPLVQVYVTPKLSLDGYASWSVDVHGGSVRDRYLGGITWAF